jgi:hypothetical protein
MDFLGSCHSLLSITKTAEAGYITVFDNKEINIFDAKTTQVFATQDPTLQGWYVDTVKLLRVPLMPTDYLPKHHSPITAEHNVYKLKMQP